MKCSLYFEHCENHFLEIICHLCAHSNNVRLVGLLGTSRSTDIELQRWEVQIPQVGHGDSCITGPLLHPP